MLRYCCYQCCCCRCWHHCRCCCRPQRRSAESMHPGWPEGPGLPAHLPLAAAAGRLGGAPAGGGGSRTSARQRPAIYTATCISCPCLCTPPRISRTWSPERASAWDSLKVRLLHSTAAEAAATAATAATRCQDRPRRLLRMRATAMLPVGQLGRWGGQTIPLAVGDGSNGRARRGAWRIAINFSTALAIAKIMTVGCPDRHGLC